MPLIKYRQYITYPDGNPAAAISLAIWRLGGNVLAPLFSDKAGIVPLANPLVTDADGLATFYAAPGSYTAELTADLFHFLVDDTETDPAWPDTFIHTEGAPASTWTITHHFGTYPAVTVVSGGQPVDAEVQHVSTSQLTITFGAPTAGVAYLRR